MLCRHAPIGPYRSGEIKLGKTCANRCPAPNSGHGVPSAFADHGLLKRNQWDLQGEPVPPRKFLVHTNGRPFESPFGTALLARCVYPEWFKRKSIRFWALFCEKRAFPPAIGRYDRARPEDKAVLLEALRTIQADTGIALPTDVQIEFLQQMSSVPVTTYREFVAAMDAWQAKIVLGQTLTTSEGQHGTQALGRVHRRTSDDLVAEDGQLLGATLDTLIEWLVSYNYAQLPAAMPRFVFDTDPGDDLKALAERDKVLAADIGIPVARSYWYHTYQLPEPTEDDPALELRPPPPPPPQQDETAMSASNVAQPPSAVGNVAQPPSAVGNVAQPPSAVPSFRDLAGDDDADRLFRRLDEDTQRLLALIASDVAEGLRKNSGG